MQHAAGAPRPTILGAGWGTSGTRSLASALSDFGFNTGHCSRYTNTSGGSYTICPLLLCKLHGELEKRLARYRLGNCTDPSLFRVFDGLDAVADTPVPHFFPYLLRAYPDARVILTRRDPDAWYKSRSANHPIAAAHEMPDYLQLLRSLDESTNCLPYRNAPWMPLVEQARSAGSAEGAAIHAMAAHEALVRTLVPTARLLEIDVTTESAAQLWHRLANFLGRPTPPTACLEEGCRFPSHVSHRVNGSAGSPRRPDATFARGAAHVNRSSSAFTVRCPLCVQQTGCLAFSAERQEDERNSIPTAHVGVAYQHM
jgi:hypothetical protein